MVHIESPTNLAIDSSPSRKLFIFDRVFGEDVSQEGVWSYLRDGVDAFVQGYNVSILAYGQSGSGKSYTMGTSGPAEQNNSHIMGRPACSITLREHQSADCGSQASFQEQLQLCSTVCPDHLLFIAMDRLVSVLRLATRPVHRQR